MAHELDTGLEARLQQAATDTVARTHDELERVAEASREKQLAELQAQLDRCLTPLAHRGEATANDLRQLLDSLQEERTRLESDATAFRRETEQARAWLAQETQQFQKLVHDALVEASGQIKGRIHLAIEMAQEPMERRTREACAQLEEMAARQTEEVRQRQEEATQRLRSLQTEMEFSVDTLLNTRMTELLEQLQQRSDELMRKSTAQLQTTLNEALESVARVLQEKFRSLS